ncbi:MAG: hypothetical protein IPL28_11345 [Chloroflexi bacterium]|nr:hypothetical protein [Chloroflexota bacterium]
MFRPRPCPSSSPHSPSPPLLTKEEIDNIVSSKNLLLRNPQITQGYYETAGNAGAISRLRNVNWFAFGTYASKTAGRAIRHESLPRALKSALIRSAVMGIPSSISTMSWPIATNRPRPKMSSAVSSNKSACSSPRQPDDFWRIGVAFVDMINQFSRDRAPRPRPLYPILGWPLHPGSFEGRGADWLPRFISHLLRSPFRDRQQAANRLIFLGNILLALHEQSRLQPVIEKALGVPFDQFAEGIIPTPNKK